MFTGLVYVDHNMLLRSGLRGRTQLSALLNLGWYKIAITKYSVGCEDDKRLMAKLTVEVGSVVQMVPLLCP